MTLIAACHCGRVRITVPGPPEFRNECHCTVCYKYGAMWGYYKKNTVSIEVKGKSVSAADPAATTTTPLPGLDLYIREDGRDHITFNRCAHCGCMTHWAGIEPSEVAQADALVGVNSRLMDETELVGVERRLSPGPP